MAERNYIAEMRLTRNRWAHPGEKPFSGDDVYRAYDTAERLLRSVAAPQADDLAKAKVVILMENAVSQAKEKQKATTAATVAAEPLKGLAPWRSSPRRTPTSPLAGTARQSSRLTSPRSPEVRAPRSTWTPASSTLARTSPRACGSC